MGPVWPVMRLMGCTSMSARRQADNRDAALTGESVRGIPRKRQPRRLPKLSGPGVPARYSQGDE